MLLFLELHADSVSSHVNNKRGAGIISVSVDC